MSHRVPFFVPDIGQAEIDSVVDSLRSGWITTGPKTKEFEQQFAEYVGAPRAIAVNSATAALHLALNALGVGRDDEVIVPTMTFTATAEVVVHLGGKPVMVDCRPDDLNLDVEQLEQRITSRTKAIIPVHYGGQPCEMDRILEIARRHKLPVVEDAAHALPAAYRSRKVGTIGDVTCFSFYANKTITTAEGGMITTADEALADRMQIRSLHGMSKDAWKRFTSEGSWYYEVVYPGYKYNMTDVASAMGLEQLKRSDDFWRGRQAVANRYNSALADVPELVTPRAASHVQHAWHLYVIRLVTDRLKIDRNRFIQELTAAKIGVSVHYLPLHMHPWYRETYGYRPQDFPVAAGLYDEIISLPIYPRMTEADVDYVVEQVKRIVAENRR